AGERVDPLAEPVLIEGPQLPRPMLLYRPPQPIGGDGVRAFTWQNRTHIIHHAEGPERIAPEWWHRPAAPARDYWRVEDTNGGRFWLFQTRPADKPGPWFLHGVFP
ncbi:hypothetical protein VZ95_16230, partial [Elstera litoralis]